MLLGGKQPNSLMVANVTIISHTECKKVRKEETVYFCICVCYCTHKILYIIIYTTFKLYLIITTTFKKSNYFFSIKSDQHRVQQYKF